ncbi:MAG TPA: FtsX-like permease family protein [Steroidobacteraceae bacterium]|jgi:putative ABC transport system permease protein|nr:FtsX-like permease family protein [Steroidobacteraceae bacterium]
MLSLLWANLNRKRLRLLLTIASIVVAFILFSLVEALQYALTGGVQIAGQDRLMTVQKVSLINPLPRSYFSRIQAADGVKSAISFNWFGGYYQQERNPVFSYPVLNEAQLTDVYPEIVVPPDQYSSWLQTRDGALIGRALATTQKWKVGDVVPLRSSIWFKSDGTNTWNFKISGIFDMKEAGDTSGLYFHYDYFNEAGLQNGKDFIGWVAFRVNDPNKLNEVAHNVDAMFTNSETETKTSSEKDFAQGFANQMGNIGKIVAVIVIAVFFTLLLVVANTMSQSIRERTNEIGVLKTLGFTKMQVTTLILAEAVLMTVIGGCIGMFIGGGAVKGIANSLAQYLPMMKVPTSAYILGFGCMIVLGLLSGLLPCMQAWQLKITDALRRL